VWKIGKKTADIMLNVDEEKCFAHCESSHDENFPRFPQWRHRTNTTNLIALLDALIFFHVSTALIITTRALNFI